MADLPAQGQARAAPAAAARGDGVRAERLVREVTYVAAGVPLGAAYACLVAVAVLAALLALVWVGLPLLLAVTALAWRCAALERTLANRLLDARIPPLPPLPAERGAGPFARARDRLRRGTVWRGGVLLALRLPAAALTAAVTLGGAALAVVLVVLGVRGVTGAEHGYFGPVALGPALSVALWLLAVPVAVVTVALGHTLTRALRALARGLLATRVPPGGPVRETLAESLGDRTLQVAYWLPERETFVDERGHRVALPEPGSDRAWTAVDYGGRRVAAIVHDANLDASPELVHTAAAAASLALDNERLKADLRARVEELRASRVRIVETALSARRRIERDLHDGAQQQLVALAVDLRVLRARVRENPQALELIDEIDAKLAAALAELRELARGIHPAILSDRGLGPALNALAARAPLPVTCEIDLPSRPPAPVEAAGYFVVAEALTNVIKYAQASAATVRARQDGDDIVVEMQDDGVGGADERRGSGLVGLHDRVGALDGTLTVESPSGEGTLVRATIPCHAGGLVERATARPSA